MHGICWKWSEARSLLVESAMDWPRRKKREGILRAGPQQPQGSGREGEVRVEGVEVGLRCCFYWLSEPRGAS